MNDEMFQDLKQFIDGTVSQSEQRMMNRMDKRFEEIEQQLGDIVEGSNQQTEIIIEHIDEVAMKFGEKTDDLEVRVTRLERRVA